MIKSATRSGTPQRAAGFSMVELAMSICVMLILTALAIPSLMRSMRAYQLNSAAVNVSDLMKFTRFEAVRQNRKISFLLKTNAAGWVAWAGPPTDTAPLTTEKQMLMGGYASLVSSGAPVGPNIAGSGPLNVVSTSSCTPACFAFDARGAVSGLQAYVLYIGSVSDPDPSYRAVVLLPSGSTQVWSAPGAGPWHKVN